MFVLRLIQEYSVDGRDAFLELEREFEQMERRRDDWPRGRRLQPLASGTPTNTLVWESEFPSVKEALDALARIELDDEHAALFRLQSPYITRARTEILEILELT